MHENKWWNTNRGECSGYEGKYRDPTDLEKPGRNIVVRESQDILFPDNCHSNLLLFLLIIDNVCHGSHHCKRAHASLQETDCFIVFKCYISSITDATDSNRN